MINIIDTNWLIVEPGGSETAKIDSRTPSRNSGGIYMINRMKMSNEQRNYSCGFNNFDRCTNGRFCIISSRE